MLSNVIGHEETKSKLKEIIKNLPRVIHFTGKKNIGKKYTALNFINEINNGYLNGKLFTHPDIYVFEPEKDSKTFKIELINKIKENINIKPFELKNKFFILNNIELMNKESSNACLKMLEDCPDNVIFIIISDDYFSVSDTIKSRSTSFFFYPNLNLGKYFLGSNKLNIYLAKGSVSRLDYLSHLNIESQYSEVKDFLNNISRITYAELIDWCESKKDSDLELINDLIHLYSKEKYLENNNSILYQNLCHMQKDYNNSINLNRNNLTNFKSYLIEFKNNLYKIN